MHPPELQSDLERTDTTRGHSTYDVGPPPVYSSSRRSRPLVSFQNVGTAL